MTALEEAAWRSGSWIFDRCDYDDEGPGSLSRELYADFQDYCRREFNLSSRDIPTETAWGRALSEEHECPSRHTMQGNRRPLRLKDEGLEATT